MAGYTERQPIRERCSHGSESWLMPCKVVKPGRIFLRRLTDLASSRTNLDHWIRINQEAGFLSDVMVTGSMVYVTLSGVKDVVLPDKAIG